jgi:hypothetical protein
MASGGRVNAPAARFSAGAGAKRCPDQQNIRRTLEQPGERNLHRRRLKRGGDIVQLLRLAG